MATALGEHTDSISDDDAAQGFRFFAASICLANLILVAERHAAWMPHDGLLPMVQIVPGLLAFAVVLSPRQLWLFGVFWAFYVYYLWLGFPGNNTNQTLNFFVGLTVLGSALRLRLRGERIDAASWFRSFAPVLRVVVVCLYFWTIWHKLNFDFLDPAVSCATRFSGELMSRLGLPRPSQSVLGPPAIVATLLAETALPVGLMFRRTQRATALFGLVFHWLLGIAGYYGFSSTMMALLPLFLMPQSAQAFSGERPLSLAGRSISSAWQSRLVLFGFVAVVAAGNLLKGIDTGWTVRMLWYGVPLYATVLWWINRSDIERSDGPTPFFGVLRTGSPLLLVAALAFMNGCSPYLGFKTEYSYAMYSNLRTEGGATNHVVWREPLSLAPYQTDLVRVLEGSDPALLEELGGRRVTRYELETALWRMREAEGRSGIALVYAPEGGPEQRLASAENELADEGSYLERRFLRFRSIVPSQPGFCAH